ncbi:MAG: cytochrome C [Betaproteobacteria bacterium RIFCSPLOWO2_02_64_14]|nr:MAG: cytochrome C [Betaproteobacteria bacterium RIFCSPLOWO2_02_64_14]
MMRIKFKAALLLVAGLLVSGGTALAEESFSQWATNLTQQKEGSFSQWMISLSRYKEVRPVDNKVYKEECSGCHMAYQPGLLPAKSWEKMLNEKAMSDHFGDDASLDADTLKEILTYAVANSADKSYYKRSRKIALATETGDAPLRITEVRYIKRKHHEIPEKMIKGNNDVKSLSFCNACHTKAEEGNFDNDTVRIPNYPNWKDR